MVVELCNGEIEFYSDGRWFCLKCDYQCEKPGNVEFQHEPLQDQRKKARRRLESAFTILVRDGMSETEAWTWLETELSNIAIGYGALA